MRYSKMLEESSFANRKADYFWLLLQSAVMLLVCPSHLPHDAFILSSRILFQNSHFEDLLYNSRPFPLRSV